MSKSYTADKELEITIQYPKLSVIDKKEHRYIVNYNVSNNKSYWTKWYTVKNNKVVHTGNCFKVVNGISQVHNVEVNNNVKPNIDVYTDQNCSTKIYTINDDDLLVPNKVVSSNSAANNTSKTNTSKKNDSTANSTSKNNKTNKKCSKWKCPKGYYEFAGACRKDIKKKIKANPSETKTDMKSKICDK